MSGPLALPSVLARVVFVPSAPLLVPRLAGPRATEAVPVRDAALAAGVALSALAPEWVAVGAADAGAAGRGPGGTFAPYGVDVHVSLRAPGASDTDHRLLPPSLAAATADSGRLPLSMLIAAWLRETAGAERVEPLIVDPGGAPETCLHTGRALAEVLATTERPVGVLVVGDGSTQLSPSAPGGGLVEESVAFNDRLVAAVGSGDRELLAGLSPEDCDRAGVGGARRGRWRPVCVLVGR